MWILALGACSPISLGNRVALPAGERPVTVGVDADAPLADAATARVLDFVDGAGVVGVSVGLVADGAVVYAAGVGWADLEAERPMTADTLVLLSSVSKTFVGTAAIQQVEAGVLALDDPASDGLDFALDNPRIEGETVTFRDLLTHNSGIRDTAVYGQVYADGDPEIGLDAFAAGYLQPGGAYWRRGNWAAVEPSETFAYSNVGMSVAALALGGLVDQPFDALLDATVLDPLGMTATAYRLADLPEAPAVPYARVVNGYRPYAQYGYPTYPDGMLRSSVNEMARYLLMITGNGTVDGTPVLTPAGVDALLEVDPAYGTDESGQAIAWAMRDGDFARGRTLFGHNGGDWGSSTEIWVDRAAGTGVVILMNGAPLSFRAMWELELDLLELVD